MAAAVSAGTTPGTAVRAQVQAVLRAAPLTPAYGAAITAALALPGNILSAAPDLRWGRTVWTCCIAAGGHLAQAVPVAAAVEIFMVALDVLDDVEDAEETPLHGALGAACTVNASTGLLLLAQQTLLATAGGAAAGLLLDAGLRACGGQHADLAPPPGQPLGLDEALAVTAGKAAPLVAVACRLGALRAGADTATQELYARFGAAAGMVAQLTNDLAALRPVATGKTDIALGRPTLPLTYAARLGLATAPDVHAPEPPPDLWAHGPLQLTWTVAATYRYHALDLIPRLTTNPASRADLAVLVNML